MTVVARSSQCGSQILSVDQRGDPSNSSYRNGNITLSIRNPIGYSICSMPSCRNLAKDFQLEYWNPPVHHPTTNLSPRYITGHRSDSPMAIISIMVMPPHTYLTVRRKFHFLVAETTVCIRVLNALKASVFWRRWPNTISLTNRACVRCNADSCERTFWITGCISAEKASCSLHCCPTRCFSSGESAASEMDRRSVRTTIIQTRRIVSRNRVVRKIGE